MRKFEINLDGETEDAIVSSSIAQAIEYLKADLARIGHPAAANFEVREGREELDADALDLVADIEAMKRVYNYYSLVPYGVVKNA